MNASKAKLTFNHDGRTARLTLAAPKANILDRAMMAELEEACDQLDPLTDLRAIVLDAEGPNFSYGASIQEHLPDQIGLALEQLGRLLRRVVGLPAPTIGAVRGQCLGGGFELVLACDLLLAEETAQLGCPEIKLGVFPPAATALLPLRVGANRAAELVLTGASWSGREAAAAGLVTRLAPEGELDTALAAWLEKDFLPRSPAALRHAARALRGGVRRALEENLPELERRYLHELMAEPDATEGIRAYLEKRPARWVRKGKTT